MEEIKDKMKDMEERYDKRIEEMEQNHLEWRVLSDIKIKETQTKWEE